MSFNQTLRETFQSPWKQIGICSIDGVEQSLPTSDFIGKSFTVLAGPNELSDNNGFKSSDDDYLHMYKVRFENGVEFWAWEEEIFVQPGGWNP